MVPKKEQQYVFPFIFDCLDCPIPAVGTAELQETQNLLRRAAFLQIPPTEWLRAPAFLLRDQRSTDCSYWNVAPV